MRCQAVPKNLPGILTEIVQAFCLYLSDHILAKSVLHTNAKIYYSFRHVDVLTRIAKIHMVTIYNLYEQMHLLCI